MINDNVTHLLANAPSVSMQRTGRSKKGENRASRSFSSTLAFHQSPAKNHRFIYSETFATKFLALEPAPLWGRHMMITTDVPDSNGL